MSVGRFLQLRQRVAGLSSGTLRAMERWLADLPGWLVMPELSRAVAEELLARELAALAEVANESGPWACAPIGGMN